MSSEQKKLIDLPWMPKDLQKLLSQTDEAAKIDWAFRMTRGAILVEYVLSSLERGILPLFSPSLPGRVKEKEEISRIKTDRLRLPSQLSVDKFPFFPEDLEEGGELIRKMMAEGIDPRVLFVDDESNLSQIEAKSAQSGITSKFIGQYRQQEKSQLRQLVNSATLRSFKQYVSRLTGEQLDGWRKGVTSEHVLHFLQITAIINNAIAADGYWRNVVGQEAIALLIEEAKKILSKISNPGLKHSSKITKRTYEYIMENKKNGMSLIYRFGGEPDLSMEISDGKNRWGLVSGEVKGRFDESNLNESWYTTIINRMQRLRENYKVFIVVQKYFKDTQLGKIGELITKSREQNINLGLFSIAKIKYDKDEQSRFEKCITGLIDFLEP